MSRIPIAVSTLLQHPLAMLRLLIALGLVLLPSPSTARSKGMAGVGKWSIDFAEHQCVASRLFGTADDRLILGIKPSPSSDVVQISLIRGGSNSGGVQNDAQIAFDAGPPIAVKELAFGVEKKRVRMIHLNAEQAARLAGAKSMDWSLHGTGRRLEIGSMAEVMKLLGDCKKDLRDYWNAEATFKQNPKPLKELIKYFVSTDYPEQAWSHGETGATSVVMLVDEKGKLADCMINETSGFATIDAMTCLVIRQRVSFAPAIGADDKPAKSVSTATIKWQLPE
jgi:hypothetical protein